LSGAPTIRAYGAVDRSVIILTKTYKEILRDNHREKMGMGQR